MCCSEINGKIFMEDLVVTTTCLFDMRSIGYVQWKFRIVACRPGKVPIAGSTDHVSVCNCN